MTSNIVVGSACSHKTLFFGTGGRVVICSLCSARWENMAQEYVEVDLNEDDQRVDPRDIHKTTMPEGGIPKLFQDAIEKTGAAQGLHTTAMVIAASSCEKEARRGVVQITVGWSPQGADE